MSCQFDADLADAMVQEQPAFFLNVEPRFNDVTVNLFLRVHIVGFIVVISGIQINDTRYQITPKGLIMVTQRIVLALRLAQWAASRDAEGTDV